jgi:hypothetical protein
MTQAAVTTTTNHPASLPEHLGELQPTSCNHAGPGEVLVSLTTTTGDLVTYSLKTAMLVRLVSLSMTLINSNQAQIFRDLDVF